MKQTKYFVESEALTIAGKWSPCYLCKSKHDGQIKFRQSFEMFAWDELDFNSADEALTCFVGTLESSDRQFFYDDNGETYCTLEENPKEIHKMSVKLIRSDV